MTELTKPVKRVASVRAMPHGFRERLVITLFPGGIVAVRELGRRAAGAVHFDMGDLYAKTLVRRALAAKKKGGR